jgi:hypothetical protein
MRDAHSTRQNFQPLQPSIIGCTEKQTHVQACQHERNVYQHQTRSHVGFMTTEKKNYLFPPRLQWLQELPETTLNILYVQNTIPISWTGLESQACLVRALKLRFTATVRRAFHQAQYFLFPVCMWQAGIWSLQANRQYRLVNGLASLNSSSSRKSSYFTLFGSLSGNFRRANWLGLFNVSFNYSNYTLHRLG